MSLNQSSRGQAAVETAFVLVVGIVPMTLAFIAFAEIAWTYHALAALTREGAQYAATHCFLDTNGSNVVAWMTSPLNAPAFPDSSMLGSGINIQVQYWTNDLVDQITEPVQCTPSCSSSCVPDAVTVSISGYTFNHFLSYFGFSGLQVPPFSTTVEIEGAGANPDTGGTPIP